MAERANLVFHNKVIGGTAIKRLISRLIDHFGMGCTSHILDQLKTLGFHQATTTSISLGIEDIHLFLLFCLHIFSFSIESDSRMAYPTLFYSLAPGPRGQN